MLPAPAGYQHPALVAHENDPIFRIEFTVLFQVSRPVRQQSAVIPMQLYRRHFSARRKLVMHHGGDRNRFFKHRRRAGRDALRRAELQGGENRRKIVNAHVAKAARAEVPPAAPAERRIGRMIWPPGCRAQPQVPVQRLGDRRRLFGPLNPLRPPQGHPASMGRTIGPNMRLAHGANRAVLEPFGYLAIPLERHALVAHLGCDLCLSGGFGHHARFIHCAGQWFLTINMLAHFHCCDRHDCMVMIRRAYHYSLDAFLLVQHLAEIFVAFGVGILLERLGGVVPVHVAQGDDIFAGDLLQVPSALAANAHSGDVQLAIGRRGASTEHPRRQEHEPGNSSGPA